MAHAVWTLFLVVSIPVSMARADQTDPALPGLFAQLHTADHETAAPVEAEIWQRWLRSGRADVDSRVAKGVAALNVGDLDTALAEFDAVTKLAPAYAEGWNKRATTLFMLHRIPESITDIGRVLALEPRHFGALSGLGLCEVELKHEREALRAFERAAAVDPSLPGVRDNIDALRKDLDEHAI